MAEFNIFKVEYSWYEGEYEETLIGKEVSVEEFEKDMIKAKEFAESLIGKKVSGDYLGKGYSVECLPEFYHQILWYLTERLRYILCFYNEDIDYDIDDDSERKIHISKCKKNIDRKEL